MISYFNAYLPHVTRRYQRFGWDFRYPAPRPLKYPFLYMHYYYPLANLAEDVFAETSVIGKHRYDNNGVHQLERYALSKDERYTFDMLAKNAAQDVYEKLIGNSSDLFDCNIYDEDNTIVLTQNNGKKITIDSITTSDQVFKMTLDTVGDHKMKVAAIVSKHGAMTFEDAMAIVEAVEGGTPTEFVDKITEYDADRITEELVAAGATCTQTQYTETEDLAQLHIAATLDKNLEPEDEFYIKVKYAYTVSNFMQEPEVRTGEYLCERPWVTGDGTTFDIFIVLPLELDKNTAQIPGVYPEELVSLDDYKCDVSIRFANPEIVEEGQLIEYHFADGSVNLYTAKVRPPFPHPCPFGFFWTMRRPPYCRPWHLPPVPPPPGKPIQPEWKPIDTNDDITDPRLFIKMDDDFRHSIHYIVKKYEYTRENSVKLVDNAIYASLKNHIILHWLEQIAPEGKADIAIYMQRYADSITNLKLYIGMTERINIISHPF